MDEGVAVNRRNATAPVEASATVVVLNHNYGDYLREAVESALGQTLPGVEVVVVDDGSTDDSLDRISDLLPAVRLVRKDNGGQTSAMNAGFAASSGPVVVFLDADDRLLPHALAEAVAAFSRDERVVKVHWPLAVVDRDGRATGRIRPESMLSHGDLRSRLLTGGPDSCQSPPQSGNAYARTFLASVMPLPELEPQVGRGSASADALLALLAPAAGRVSAMYDPGSEYRIHGANDYAGMGIVEKARRHKAIQERHFALAEAFWATRDLSVRTDRWRASSWFCRLSAAFDEIERLVPPGGVMVLVDGDEWRPRFDRRTVLPFLERGGQYWGPPGNGDTAVAELERMCASGATHLVVAWQCFWWFETYPELAEHLAQRCRLLRGTGDVVVYELGAAPPAAPLSVSSGDVPTGSGLAAGAGTAVAPRSPRSAAGDVGAEAGGEHHADLAARLSDQLVLLLRQLLPAGSRCALVDFPDHENVGDSAIWLGELVALQRAELDVAYTCTLADYRPDRLAAAAGDGPILIHGGGNLGDLWPRHQEFREEIIARFRANRIVQLPQTVHFGSRAAADRARAVFDAHSDLTLLVRDEASRDLAGRLFQAGIRLAPDSAFALGPLPRPASPVVPVRWLARTDSESAPTGPFQLPVEAVDWLRPTPTDLPDDDRWPAGPGARAWPSPLDERARRRVLRGCRLLAEGRVVVTDRLHGHVLSLLLGLPHVLLDDAHGKVRGFYDTWTSGSASCHFAQHPDQAWAIAQELLADLDPPIHTVDARRRCT